MADITFGALLKTCPIDILMKKTDSRLVIPLAIALKLQELNKLLKPEWAIVFIGTEENKPETENDAVMARIFKVTDIYLPAQEVNASNFDFVDEQGKTATAHYIGEKVKEEFGEDAKIIGSLHRHPGNMTTYSQNDAFSCFAAWPIGALMVDGPMLSNIVVYMELSLPESCAHFHSGNKDETVFRYYEIGTQYTYQGLEEMESLPDLIKERVKPKVYKYAGQVAHATSRWEQLDYTETVTIGEEQNVSGTPEKIEERLMTLGYMCEQGIWNRSGYPINRALANTIGL